MSLFKHVLPDNLKSYLLTHCFESEEEGRTAETRLMIDTEAKKSLTAHGCEDSYSTVLALAIGESLSLGFPQGSYFGLVITRIG